MGGNAACVVSPWLPAGWCMPGMGGLPGLAGLRSGLARRVASRKPHRR